MYNSFSALSSVQSDVSSLDPVKKAAKQLQHSKSDLHYSTRASKYLFYFS